MKLTGLDKLTMSSGTHFSVSLTWTLTQSSTPQLGNRICPLAYIFTFNTIMSDCSLATKLMKIMFNKA